MDEQFELDVSTADPGTIVLRVTGELDTSTADRLPEAIAAHMGAASRCVIDLGGCTFIDSSGIRGLLLSHRQLGDDGEIELINVDAKVERTLRIAGVERVLGIATAGE